MAHPSPTTTLERDASRHPPYSADRILPVLRARLDAAVPFPPELVLSAFPHDAALRGALALILDEVRAGAPPAG
jgi:hypothetical protein